MDTDAYSPFAAQCFTWRGPGGQWTLTVVCKATFELRPGLSPVTKESEPILEVDREGEGGVMWEPGDLAPVKPKVDVLVVGSAFAPPGQTVKSLVARIAVETIDKSIRVVSPRTVMRTGYVREGAPWSEMAMGYDRAAGGAGTWNLAGVAHDALDRHGRRSLPSLEPIDWEGDPATPIPPVGLGPIPVDWPPRRDRLTAEHHAALETGWQERPFPASLDASFFQSAPEDQRLDELPPGVAITLEHLHRDAPELFTRLEDVRPTATVEVRGRPPRSVALKADLLWIDTDRSICTVVWRGHVTVASRDEEGLVTVCDEREVPPEDDLRAPSVGTFARGRSDSDDGLPIEDQHTATDGETLQHGAVAPRLDPLPFRPPPASGPMPARLPMSLPASQGPSAIAVLGSGPPSQPPLPAAPPSSFRGTIGQRVAPFVEQEKRQVLDRATYAGAVQASHAAAEIAPRSVSAPEPSARPDVIPIELVWFEPAVVARVRATESFKPYVREHDPSPLADEGQVADARARADRATVSAVLARAELVTDVEGHLLASVTEDGALEPRLGVVDGVVEWGFDDVETLKIWTATVAALAPGDKKVKEVVDSANETMATPLGGEPDVARSFVDRLRDAWTKAQKALPNDYIDKHARRLLLSQRHYDKRTFGDAEWIRGTLSRSTDASRPSSGRAGEIPVYVPSSAARALPLFVRARGRVLGDVVPQRDETEQAPVAVLVRALARVIPPVAFKSGG